MRSPCLLFGLLLALTASTHATAQGLETILRAGEHRDFTRLVMALPENIEWRLSAGPGHVDLLFKSQEVSIDLSETFVRIPRTRLREVKPVPDGIRLMLGCPCPVQPVAGINGQLVLDIRTPKAPPEQPAPDVRPTARPVTSTPPPVARRAGVTLAKALRKEADAVPMDALSLDRWIVATAIPEPSNPPTASAKAAVATALTTTLSNAVSGAVVNNLLTTDPTFTPAQTAPSTALLKDAARHIQSQRDRRDDPQALPNQACEQAISNWMPEWGDTPKIATQGRQWADLYDPLDKLNVTVANDLLKSLLRAGFGAEARSILSLLPDTPHAASLESVSYLVDLEQPPDPMLLPKFSTCSDMDALFGFLSDPATRVTASDTKNRVVRAIQAVPPPLKQHLGTALLHKLLREGAEQAANLVQAALNRTREASKPTNTLTKMLLAQPEAMTDLDADQLLDLSDPDLLLLLENAQRKNQKVSQDVLNLAMDRQFALRRSALGRSFALVTARALASSGAFDAAFRMAKARDTDLSDPAREALLAELFDSLVQTASDTTFVTSVFEQQPWQETALPFQTRAALSKRLDALGFADVAKQLQQRSPIEDPTTPRTRKDGPLPEAGPIEMTSLIETQADQTSQLSDQPDARDGDRPKIAPAQTSDDRSTDRAEVPLAARVPAGDAGPQRTTPITPERPGPPVVEPGLLEQSRRVLESSEVLRAGLQGLIEGPTESPPQ